MFERIYKMWLIPAAGVLYSASLMAQPQSNWTDFGYIKHSDAWLTSENASGLNNLKIGKISLAEAFFNKSDGKFINFYQSGNSYTFGGRTESFFRLNEKVVFYGKMDYSDFSGKNMGGSTLIDPYYNSFDIVEYADSTAGTKKMETYGFNGALSVHLWHGILLGLKADYKTISYFKTRDLRHANDLMDLSVTAGIRYRLKKIVDAGMNYYYRKTTENTSYESIGKTDQQFNSLISFGSFFGRQERFSDEGYTGEDDNNPFFNKFHGVSLQLDILPGRNLHFFNELSVKLRDGYFGKHSSTSVMYTRNEGDIFQYRGLISLARNKALHQLELKLAQENRANYEKAYREETSTAGNKTTVYYGETKVLNGTFLNASAGYTGNLQVSGNNPGWVVNAGACFYQKDQTVIIYPDYRKQTINQLMADASIQRNSIHQNNMYSFRFGGAYGWGSGTEKEDGSYSSGSVGSADALDRYLYREYEYFTSSRVTGKAGFRYSRMMRKNLRVYGDIQYTYTRAFSIEHIGDTFGQLAVGIGCLF